jgi:3D (Asp-Asp-Asp) domain-containing protein
MIAELVLLGTLTATSYRAVPEQTKPSCTNRHHCETSIGENVSELGVAVSPDLLASGRVHYRDCLYIPGVGFRIINDTTNSRLYNSVDIFVYEKSEEKRFGVRHLQVWLVVVMPKTKIARRKL